VIVRLLERGDLVAVAAIHLAAFPDAAISGLGLGAARRFYVSLLDGPHDAVGLGASEGGRLVGYCFGGVWRNAEVFFVRSNLEYLAWRVLTHPWLFFQPLFLDRVRLGLRLAFPGRPARNRMAPPEELLRGCFGIQSIAVHPAFQGRGAGKELLEASEAIARRRGFRRMDLSVHTDNRTAVAFYERMGWEKYLTGGVWRGFMFRRLD
jgi:GNAT superfamily N-acetyltransferase